MLKHIPACFLYEIICPHYGGFIFDLVFYSIFIGKITIGMPNLKNLFCIEKIV
jgi:hypothetical protein